MHLKCGQLAGRHLLGLQWRGPAKKRSLLGGAVASLLLTWGQCVLAVPPEHDSPESQPLAEALPSAVIPLEVLPLEGVSSSAWDAEDIPEEILRTEIITGARSPLTGESLSAAEYAQLQATLAAPAGGTLISDDLRYLIFLLQFRRAVRPIVPFL